MQVALGHRGQVVGPCCAPSMNSGRERVLVQFLTATGAFQFNYTVGQQLRHAPLLEGMAKGDYVLAIRQLAHVRLGDEGLVVGANATSHMRVDFGGRVRECLASDLRLAPLCHGSSVKKGDRVTARCCYEEVALGDRGVVVGRCSKMSLDNAHKRVQVDWGPQKGVSNWTLGKQLELL